MARPKTEYACAFCGRKASEFPEMEFLQSNQIEDAYICMDCVHQLFDVLCVRYNDWKKDNEIPDKTEVKEEVPQAENEIPKGPYMPGIPLNRELPRPDEIKSYLDEYIVGQQEAKETLSVAAYNHYKLLRYQALHREETDAVQIGKSNLLMCGPSGVGKTATVKRLAKFLEVPVAICDCASLSKTGYTGRDPSSLIHDLISSAEGNMGKAEGGIIYLDEFDKIAKSFDPVNQDITGEGVQQELLKLIEGTVIEIPRQIAEGLTLDIRFDTKNILFICGGAFDGIEQIIQRRIGTDTKQRTIGFGMAMNLPKDPEATDTGTIMKVTTADFIKYGIIPEVLGRLPVICPLKPLDRDELVRILTEPKDSIVRQYKALLAMDNARLTFTRGALDAIADEALRRKTGARGLRSLMEQILNPIMFKIPQMVGPVDMAVTKAAVTGKREVEIRNELAG